MQSLFDTRSDELVGFREMVNDLTEFGRSLKTAVGTILEVRAVIDTQIILAELKWLVSVRKDASARTALQEAIAARTVIPYAPELLRQEVTAKLPVLAEQTKRTIIEYERAWDEYSNTIHFVPVRISDAEAESKERDLRDKNDLAFLLAAEAVHAAVIISRDRDVKAAGVAVLDTIECVLDLRDYSRARAVEVKFSLLGVGTFMLTASCLKLLAVSVRALGRAFLRAPWWAKTLIVATLLLPFLHPKVREKANELLHKATASIKDFTRKLEPMIAEAGRELREAQPKRTTAQERLVSRLDLTSSPTSVKERAFTVCVEARSPLSVDEIAHQIVKSGFRTTNKSFETYVRRVLRGDDRMVELSDGRWKLAPQ